MAHFLTVSLVPLLLALSLLQIVAIAGPLTDTRDPQNGGIYRIVLDSLYLSPSNRLDEPVRLNSTCDIYNRWKLTIDDQGANRLVTIRNLEHALYLTYDHQARPGSYVTLGKEPRHWRLIPGDSEGSKVYEIHSLDQYQRQSLVMHQHPDRVVPPMVGLVVYRKGGLQSWGFEDAEEEAAVMENCNDDNDDIQPFLSLPQQGVYYMLQLRGQYLAQTDPTFGGPVRLFTSAGGPVAQWTVSYDGKGKNKRATIRNRASGLYLSYDPIRPQAPLMVQKEAQQWTFAQASSGGGKVQILTADLVEGEHRAVVEHPIHVWPPMVGLDHPRKDGSQDWEFIPVNIYRFDNWEYQQYPLRKEG